MKKYNVELLSLAQEIAKIGSWEVDIALNKCFWSDITYQIHEVPIGTEIKLEDGLSFYTPEYKSIIESCVNEGIKTGKPWDEELQIITGSGSIKWVRAIGRAVKEDGKLTKLEGVFQDINEKKIQEIEYQTLNERYKLAISASNVGIWDWDIVNNVLNWDQQMFNIYGASKKQFSSAYEAWANGLHPDDRELNEKGVQEALEGKKDFRGKFRIITNDGETRTLATLSKVLRNEKGEPVRMIGSNWDITQEVKDKESLLSLNEELVQFAYRTSHDLKSPLLSMKGIIALSLESLVNEEYDYLEKDLNTIDSLIDRLTKLIQDMMDLTKIDHMNTNVTKFNFEEELKNLAEAHAHSLKTKQIIFKTEIDIQSDLITEEIRLRHVLENLFSNSIKYMDDSKPVKKIKIQATEENHKCIIKVIDNGTGIAKEFHKDMFKMFKRFHQNVEGTGLGLYMIKKNVEAINGEISFTSNENETVFKITIPLCKK